MSTAKKKRFRFHPGMDEPRLEERVVLSTTAQVYVLTPSTAAVTPAPAPSPVSAQVALRQAAIEAGTLSSPLTIARLRTAYRQQVHAATRDLRAALQSGVNQFYASGSTPSAQQVANFNASVGGALNATALRLATQVSLLPNGGSRLIPVIESRILGSGANSLASRLTSLATSGRLVRANGILSPALNNLTTQSARQGLSLVNSYFNTTPVARLSVNSNGQRIPIQQYMGNQLLNEVGNALGALAYSYPSVANSILYPNGTTSTPTSTAIGNFTTAVNNALGTAAYQLGSGLALFPNYSSVVSRLQPVFYGSTGTTGGTGVTGSLGGTGGVGTTTGGATFSNLVSALSGLPYGTTSFSTAVSNAFNGAYQNLVTPIARYFGMNAPTTVTLPTTGFASPFGTSYLGNSFYNGFNGGFSTGASPGYIGFGMAPSTFNNSFGTGFNNFVTTYNTGLGLNGVGLGSGVNGIGSGFLTGTGGGITGSLGTGSGGTGLTGTGSGGTGLGTGSGVGGVGSGLLTGTGGGIG